MQLWLKQVLWVSATFIAVWLAAVFYWQSTARLPAQSELLIYLGLLPLALIGVGWGINKAISHESAPTADKTAAAKLKAGEDDAKRAQQQAEQQRSWYLNILASSLQTSAGSTTADVLAKLKDGEVQAELDPELKNEDGFAVFSARIADLDVTNSLDAFNEWAVASGLSELQWSEAQLRALHLASTGFVELTQAAASHCEVQLFQQRAEHGRSRTAADELVPNLQLMTLWPQGWEKPNQLAASSWLRSLAIQHGWPERRILANEPSLTQANPLELVDQICLQAGRTQIPTGGILTACDCGIDQNAVDALTSRGQLFGGKNTGGSKPGEVAAGLLFADKQQGRLFGQPNFSKLHRASWALREKSADERGKISADLLSTVLVKALKTGKVDPQRLKFVSADNDHKPAREAELAQMFSSTLPDLDFLKDGVKVAQTCGSAHHALTVAALCIAHQYVVNEQLPAVCVRLQAPFFRAAVALSPDEIGEEFPALTASAQNPLAPQPTTA